MEQKLERIKDLICRLNRHVPITLTPESVLKHLDTEEITDIEFADDEFMLERIQTWDEMF